MKNTLASFFVVFVAFMFASSPFAAEKPASAKPDPKAIAFFEAKIRPLLTENCYQCHGIANPRGGLDLRSRETIIRGGDTGAAIVPGDPDQSLLVKAVCYESTPKMPPKGKLGDHQIRDLIEWVRLGAPWTLTTDGGDRAKATKPEQQRDLPWSFRPLRVVAVPQLPSHPATRPPGRIDRFLFAELAKRGLKPGPLADRRTLVRRVTFDLTGLPPTPEEIEAFVNDKSPKAWENLIERLLASPRFGERWGRHWLDVARYADSNGLDENIVFENAWRYRDYVIRSFNGDKPFDQFIREQIAGDLIFRDAPTLPLSHSPSQSVDFDPLIGSGFLVLGPKILAERDKGKLVMDVIDEQIDTTFRAFMGLTLGCARCHDHKFDPIPTRDYYALAGIFKSTQTLFGNKLNNVVVSGWMERPLAPLEAVKAWQEHEAQVKKVQDELKKMKDGGAPASTKNIAPKSLAGVVVDDEQAEIVGMWKPSTFSEPWVGKHYLHDDNTGKGSKSAKFTPSLPQGGKYQVRIVYSTGASRATDVPITVTCIEGTKSVRLNQRVPPSIYRVFEPIGTFRFDAGASGSVLISNDGTDGHVIVDAVQFVPEDQLDASSKAAPSKKAELEAALKQLQAHAPSEPSMAMAAQDAAKVENCKICIRGNHENLGADVPRGFVTVVSHPATQPPSNSSSGRLELANWIASADNPLTSRVAVNRIWMHLFGRGLVATPDDFGARGEKPTHPELLDYLARRFIENGWSVKKMIREVMLSETYQRSSDETVGRSFLTDTTKQSAATTKKSVSVRNDRPTIIDPENKLLWRQNRRRLEAECLRDAMLAASGALDPTMGGTMLTIKGVQVTTNNSTGSGQFITNRRSVYVPVVRNDTLDIFQVFDFVDPHVLTGRRSTTTVAPQALYMLNSPFVIDQSQKMAEMLLKLEASDAKRIEIAYLRALGRTPTAKEVERVQRYVASEADPKIAWRGLCQSLFASVEFRLID